MADSLRPVGVDLTGLPIVEDTGPAPGVAQRLVLQDPELVQVLEAGPVLETVRDPDPDLVMAKVADLGMSKRCFPCV